MIGIKAMLNMTDAERKAYIEARRAKYSRYYMEIEEDKIMSEDQIRALSDKELFFRHSHLVMGDNFSNPAFTDTLVELGCEMRRRGRGRFKKYSKAYLCGIKAA